MARSRRECDSPWIHQKNTAGWSSLVTRQAHNLKIAGSNPAPATNIRRLKDEGTSWFDSKYPSGILPGWPATPCPPSPPKNIRGCRTSLLHQTYTLEVRVQFPPFAEGGAWCNSSTLVACSITCPNKHSRADGSRLLRPPKPEREGPSYLLLPRKRTG